MRRWALTVICSLAGLVQARAESPWMDEASVAPFVFRSEFPLRDVDGLVQELGELQADLHETLGLDFRDRPVEIHLFSGKWSYQKYVSSRSPGGEKRQALYLPGQDAGRVYAYRHRDLETDVRHEATHALLRNSLPYVPLWLDEGLAEYFEVPRGARLNDNPHRKSLQWAIRFGWKPRLEALEAKREMLDMGGKDYRDAWGWVHFLLHGPPEAREEMAAYFAEIDSGRAPVPLSERLKRRLPDLERRVIQHLK